MALKFLLLTRKAKQAKNLSTEMLICKSSTAGELLPDESIIKGWSLFFCCTQCNNWLLRLINKLKWKALIYPESCLL